jgi:isopenicillin-N N-acyltransferase like protein
MSLALCLRTGPSAICRKQEGESTTATLFNIVMELKEKRAVVRLGKPCAPEEVIHLSFDD